MTACITLALALATTPEVSSFTLDNGIPVITRTVPGDVEGLSVFILGGTRVRTPEDQGIEALALEAAMAGGGEFPGERWREVMDRTRAELTGSYNYDFSRLHLRCLSEDLPLLALGLARCLDDPELSPESVQRVRRQSLASLSLEAADPDEKVWLVCNEGFMPPGHPYLLRPEGTPETVEPLTAEDLRRLLESRVRAGNLLITHAGPTEPDPLKQLLEASFGRLPGGMDPIPPVPPLYCPRDTMSVREMNATTTYAVVKFGAPPAGHPDQPAFQAAMMVVDELLWQVLRTDSALTYAAGAGVTTTYEENWGFMYVTTSEPARACRLMTGVLAGVSRGEIPDELLQGVVNTQVTLDGIRAQSMDTHCWLAGAGMITTGLWSTLYDAQERFGHITPEEAAAALRRWAVTAAWGFAAEDEAALGIPEPIPLGVHPVDDDGLVSLSGTLEVLLPGTRSETLVLTDGSTRGTYALVGDLARRLVLRGAREASVRGRLSREGWSVREELPRILLVETWEE